MKRSKFSLSHYKLLTCNMGELIPLTWYEVLPGDTIRQATSALIRCSPLLAPVMHPVRVRIHHFFIPNRLLWENWEPFITGGPEGTSVPTVPYIALTGAVTEGSLHNYLGIPPENFTSTPIPISALPFRAYNLIWNNFYRDQDLSTEKTVSLADGADSTTDTDLLRCTWEKDYFTTARPWETKGDAITIPLLGTAPVQGIGFVSPTWGSSSLSNVVETGRSGTTTYDSAQKFNGTAGIYLEEDPNDSDHPGIYAQLDSASGVSINDLRLALALQRFQENRAAYGSRYVEYLRSLGVRSSDARLGNPEYLGGGRQVIQFSEVLQTAEGTDPVGSLKGHGISAMRTNRYLKYFDEHGIVMTLMSVVPKSIYTQGVHRSFNRTEKEHYWQRELQNIGEQEVENREVYGIHSSSYGTFGYQARYDEYRSLPSSIAGEFHSTMDHWHYGRVYSGDPSLNNTWVEATPTKRVNADESADCLYVMANHSIQARRLVSRKASNKTF